MFVAPETPEKFPPEAPTELFGEGSGGVSPFYKHTTPPEFTVIAQVENLSQSEIGLCRILL